MVSILNNSKFDKGFFKFQIEFLMNYHSWIGIENGNLTVPDEVKSASTFLARSFSVGAYPSKQIIFK